MGITARLANQASPLHIQTQRWKKHANRIRESRQYCLLRVLASFAKILAYALYVRVVLFFMLGNDGAPIDQRPHRHPIPAPPNDALAGNKPTVFEQKLVDDRA